MHIALWINRGERNKAERGPECLQPDIAFRDDPRK